MVETTSTGVPEQAQAAKDEALNQASDLKDVALEHVGAMSDDAKQKATDVARDVRRELKTQGDAQARRAASVLHDVGSQLTDMASAGQPGPVSDVTRQLANTSRQVASRLEEGGVQGISDDLRRFARRQPGLFLAAASLTGFLVTRMLRNAQGNGLPSGQSDVHSVATPPSPLDVGAPSVPASPPGTVL